MPEATAQTQGNIMREFVDTGTHSVRDAVEAFKGSALNYTSYEDGGVRLGLVSASEFISLDIIMACKKGALTVTTPGFNGVPYEGSKLVLPEVIWTHDDDKACPDNKLTDGDGLFDRDDIYYIYPEAQKVPA